MKPEDIKFSSSSVDDFFKPQTRQASSGRIRVSSLHDLAGFQFVAEDTLVRLSKQDFWQLNEDDDGPYIERLVSDDDGPVAY
jgi:hypothetical protein